MLAAERRLARLTLIFTLASILASALALAQEDISFSYSLTGYTTLQCFYMLILGSQAGLAGPYMPPWNSSFAIQPPMSYGSSVVVVESGTPGQYSFVPTISAAMLEPALLLSSYNASTLAAFFFFLAGYPMHTVEVEGWMPLPLVWGPPMLSLAQRAYRQTIGKIGVYGEFYLPLLLEVEEVNVSQTIIDYVESYRPDTIYVGQADFFVRSFEYPPSPFVTINYTVLVELWPEGETVSSTLAGPEYGGLYALNVLCVPGAVSHRYGEVTVPATVPLPGLPQNLSVRPTVSLSSPQGVLTALGFLALFIALSLSIGWSYALALTGAAMFMYGWLANIQMLVVGGVIAFVGGIFVARILGGGASS